MNPTNKETSAVQVPSAVEQPTVVAPGSLPEVTPAGAEQAPGGEVMLAGTANAVPAMSTIPLPTLNPMPTTATPGPAVPVASAALSADDDNDLIEKEWVEKAKQIVERTKSDPYKQSEELTVFKADYLKKRYGKTIKVSR